MCCCRWPNVTILRSTMDQEQYRVVSSPQKDKPKRKRTMGLRISSDSTMGGRKHQEDRILVAFHRKDDADYACVCVFDGHGGEHASVYARDHLWENIKQQEGFFSRDHQEVIDAIRRGFHHTQSEMWKVRPTWPRTASGYASTAGTTVSMAIICGNDMYIAHLGDSRIAIGRQSAKGIEADVLTRDHKPNSPRELRRIQKAGGKVQKKSGVDRVVWTRTKNDHQGPVRRTTTKYEIPFLAVARSLGDLWSYNYDSCEYIVSPDPEIGHHTIDSTRDRFLILASDGLWNVASVYDCVNMADKYSAQRYNNANGLMKETISHKLVKRGMDLWNYRLLRADNITVVTCYFEEPERLSDEEDQLDIDSARDWANVGLELRGPHPKGLSPLKPPLRRRLACPKLSSLENYNMCFCQSHKKQRRDPGGERQIPADPWAYSSIQPVDNVKTCNCGRISNMAEVRARAKQTGGKTTTKGPKTSSTSTSKILYARPYVSCRKVAVPTPSVKAKPGDKILYPRPYVSCRKRPQSEPEALVVKKMKVTDSRRDSIQALSPSECNPGESSPVGSLRTNPVLQHRELPLGRPMGNLLATTPIGPGAASDPESGCSTENGANAENEGATPTLRKRSPIRRSPRIQAAAFTIPKRRRSCTIR